MAGFLLPVARKMQRFAAGRFDERQIGPGTSNVSQADKAR
jgi:hypothetical protein